MVLLLYLAAACLRSRLAIIALRRAAQESVTSAMRRITHRKNLGLDQFVIVSMLSCKSKIRLMCAQANQEHVLLACRHVEDDA